MTDTSNRTPGASTIPQFCRNQNISEPTYYKLKKRNRGPKELRIDGIVRITDQAAADWQRALENPSADEAVAVARAADARRERARNAAKKAIKSPLHVSQRGTAG